MKQAKVRLAVLIPAGLSLGVVKSQLWDFFKDLNGVEVVFITTRTDELGFPAARLGSLKEVKSFISENKIDFLYIRSITDYFGVYKSLKKLPVQIIYGFRSFLFVESYFKNRNLMKASVLFLMELKAYYTADRLTAVTNVLRSKCRKYFGRKRDMLLTPCYCAENFEWDSDKAKRDVIKFVYVGGASKWQCVEETIQLYSSIYKSGINVSFTIYSGSPEAFEGIISTLPESCAASIEVKSVPRSQLLKELPSYDIGFLLRHDILVNNVASPIKFFEYTGAGVIPLTTRNIGDLSKDKELSEIALFYDFSEESKFQMISKLKEFKGHQETLVNKLDLYVQKNSIKRNQDEFAGFLLSKDIFAGN